MIETATFPHVTGRAASGTARTPDDRPLPIRSILFPSDLSPASDLAFDHARLLAERFGARLVLYHVVRAQTGTTDVHPGDLWLQRARAARDHLDRQVAGLATDSSVVVWRAESAEADLPAYVRSIRPDLTVMATHGRDGLAHVLGGSITETVMRDGKGAVLCVREPTHGVALPYRRILVPTDLSPESRRAFPLAAFLARTFDAEVLALHVIRVDVPRRLLGVSYAMEASPSEEAVQRFLDPEFRNVRVRPRLLLGSAWRRIVETAQAERVDLVVISTHGHDSLADTIMGSHAEDVVRHAPCPVLVV